MSNDIWEGLPAAMKTLNFRPLFVIRLKVAPSVYIGATPSGIRRVAAVEGGIFESTIDGLSGHVHAGGNDWITQPADGSVHLDARVVLETKAGDTILMSYYGMRHGSPEVLDRVARGEPVDPADYYFRTNPLFETSSPTFGWLNRVVTVGFGYRLPDGVAYSVFEVL